MDILGLGVVTVDDLVYVDAYPPPDVKVPILRRERQSGGLTGTALVAASRLGSKCAYAGTLGTDDLSQFVIERLTDEGLDLSHLRRQPDVRPIHSIVVVDEGRHTRNIFFDARGFIGAEPDWPEAGVIASGRVLFVDHWGVEGMIRAARIAREANIPVVGDLENDSSPRFPELLELVDHLIVSHSFAARLTDEQDPASATRKLWGPQRMAVVVTCGAEGCWYLGDPQGGLPQHQVAYPVETVDTTGCRDVFHGAYASALARGLGLPERVRFASAARCLTAGPPPCTSASCAIYC